MWWSFRKNAEITMEWAGKTFQNDAYIVAEDFVKCMGTFWTPVWERYTTTEAPHIQRHCDIVLAIRTPLDTTITLSSTTNATVCTYPLLQHQARNLYLPIIVCMFTDVNISFEPAVPYYELEECSSLSAHYLLGRNPVFSRTLGHVADGGLFVSCDLEHPLMSKIRKLEKWRKAYLLRRLQRRFREKVFPFLKWKQRMFHCNLQILYRPYGEGGYPGPGMAGVLFLETKKLVMCEEKAAF